VIFGASVGVGYGISVSTANLAAKHKGLITGLIVAAFATTPVFLAPLLKSTIAAQGPAAAMRGIGYVMLAFAPIVYLCLSYGRVQLPMPKVAADSQPLAQVRKTVLIMWAAYALGSAGGMTVVSHVTGIVVSFAGSTTQAVGTVASCAMGNWCGRILAGVGSDVFGPKAVIVAGALGASAILATLQCFFQGNAVAAQIGLTLLGLCFGATLTAYPVLVRRMVGAKSFGLWFGKVFTGFGLSAFLAPVVAGALYDRFHTYTVAMNFSAVLCLISIAVLHTLPDYFE